MEKDRFIPLLPFPNRCAYIVLPFSDGYLPPFGQQVARIGDQGLAPMQAARYLNLRSHILSHIDGNEMYFVVCSHRDYVHAILVDHQRRGGNDERFLWVGDDELNLSIHAW